MSARKPTLPWIVFGLVVDFLLLVVAVLGHRLEQVAAQVSGEPAEYGVWAFMAGWAIINGALHTALLRNVRAKSKGGFQA